MQAQNALLVFEALSSGMRLAIYRLLVKHAPNGLVAGDIAEQLQIAPSSLSFHLKELRRAELIDATPESRFIRYRANLPLMRELIDYLSAECCQGDPQQCSELPASSCCGATASQDNPS